MPSGGDRARSSSALSAEHSVERLEAVGPLATIARVGDVETQLRELADALDGNRKAATAIEPELIAAAADFVGGMWADLAKRAVVNHAERAQSRPDDVRDLKVALGNLQRDVSTIVAAALEPALWVRLPEAQLAAKPTADPKWDARRSRTAPPRASVNQKWEVALGAAIAKIWEPISSYRFVTGSPPIDAAGGYRRPPGPLPAPLVEAIGRYDDIVVARLELIGRRTAARRQQLRADAERLWESS